MKDYVKISRTGLPIHHSPFVYRGGKDTFVGHKKPTEIKESIQRYFKTEKTNFTEDEQTRAYMALKPLAEGETDLPEVH